MTATALALGHEATDEELKAVSDGFEGAPPELVVRESTSTAAG